MNASTHSARLSSVFLLLVVLTGWIGAPLVHEIEHALKRAEMTHVHDVHDEVTLRTGCDVLPELADECPISLSQVQAIRELETPEAGPFATTRGWGSLFELEYSRPDTYRFVRGPPAA